MSCLCATATLKIFVRSVVKLEIGSTTAASTRSSSSSLRQWRKNRNSAFLLTSRAAFGQVRGSSSSPAKREAEEGKNGKESSGKAVADLSTASIDELVAELNSEEGSVFPYEEGVEQPRQRRRKAGESLVRKIYAPPREGGQQANPIHTKRLSRTDSDDAGRQWERGTKTEDPDDSSVKDTKPRKDDWTPPPRAHWQIDKAALKSKFPEGWAPHRRLSPDALAGIRALHAQMPTEFTTAALADRFQVSPEAIRRILKSKWTPNAEEETERARRWIERGKKVYEKHVAEGGKAPKRWREMGVGVGAGRRARERARRKREAITRGRNGGDTDTERKRVLPALVTTTRRKREGFGKGRDGDGLEGRIL